MPFSDYRTTSGYGYRTHPVTGQRGSFHAGIDLVKAHRSPIKAFTAGKVVYAGEGKKGSGLGGYGIVVLIEDDYGYGHLYAHLHSAAVKTGQVVNAGDVIGRQGATGNVTGAHLHYEISKTTSPHYGWTADKTKSTVDPTQYLRNYKPKKVAQKSVAWKRVDGDWKGQTLRNGQFGKPVEQLQTMLATNNPPFYPEKGAKNNGVDGYFGAKTEDAVKRFQSYYGLAVDGLAGKKTYAKLKKNAGAAKAKAIKVGDKVAIKKSAKNYANTGAKVIAIPARVKGDRKSVV